MFRLAVNISIFCSGLLSAFGMFWLAQNLSYEQTQRAKLESILKQSTLVPKEVSRQGLTREEKERRILSNPTFPQSQRIEKLQQALKRGSIYSLELIRQSYLKTLPRYEKEIFPALKKVAIEAILERLTSEDYENWGELKNNQSTTSDSAARKFIDNLILVNPEIGIYVDTAAHLFHGMYLVTKQGGIYNLQGDVNYIQQNYKSQSGAGKETSLELSLGIIDDKIFKESLEELRGKFVTKFGRENPTDVLGQLSLISSLNPQNLSHETLNYIREFINKFTFSSSPELRKELITVYAEQLETLAPFADTDSVVGIALSEFYLACVIDFLELDDIENAQKMLENSVLISEGLKSQELVADALAKKIAEKKSRDLKNIEREDYEASMAGNIQEKSAVSKPKSKILESIKENSVGRGLLPTLLSLFSMIFVLLIVVLIFGLFIKLRNRTQLKKKTQFKNVEGPLWTADDQEKVADNASDDDLYKFDEEKNKYEVTSEDFKTKQPKRRANLDD